MTITCEISLRNFEFWSGAVENAKEFTLEELDELEGYFEELYPDGITNTQINDTFWFESDTLHAWLGHRSYRITLWDERYVDLKCDDDSVEQLERDYPYTVTSVEEIKYDYSLPDYDDFDLSEFVYPTENMIWTGDIPEYAIGAMERGAGPEECVDLDEEDVKNIRDFLDKIGKLAEGHDWYIVYNQEDWEGGASFSNHPAFGLPVECVRAYIYKRVVA